MTLFLNSLSEIEKNALCGVVKGLDKNYFLHHLVQKYIIPESEFIHNDLSYLQSRLEDYQVIDFIPLIGRNITIDMIGIYQNSLITKAKSYKFYAKFKMKYIDFMTINIRSIKLLEAVFYINENMN